MRQYAAEFDLEDRIAAWQWRMQSDADRQIDRRQITAALFDLCQEMKANSQLVASQTSAIDQQGSELAALREETSRNTVILARLCEW